MSFLKSIFGKFQSNSENDKGIEEHLDYLKSLRKPAIAFSKSDRKTFSRIGGLPELPENMEWPRWKDSPLAFLCQLDMAEIPEESIGKGLPKSGVLYFFYDQKQETWGYEAEDKGGWQVIYTSNSSESCSMRTAPEGLSKEGIFRENHIDFTPIETYPSWDDDRVESLNLTDKQSEQYIDNIYTEVFNGKPMHHLLGYPSPVQDNDMDLDCQLITNGLNLDDFYTGNDPKAKELAADRSDWILLLQLDTDDDVDMMWGDAGMLYFWIKKTDLEKARFEDSWMILQCY